MTQFPELTEDFRDLVVFPTLSDRGRAITSDRIQRFELCGPFQRTHKGWGKEVLLASRACSTAILKGGGKAVCAGDADDNQAQLEAWEREHGL